MNKNMYGKIKMVKGESDAGLLHRKKAITTMILAYKV
jgi:hypothetical protein